MAEGKKKILIIDDDSFLLDMYAFKFSENNFDVITASGTKQALEKLTGGLNPDIILCDIIMADMDGFEMLEKLKADKIAESSIKIILSNKSEQADFERGKNLGVAGYIVKASSTPGEVIDKVKEILIKKSVVK